MTHNTFVANSRDFGIHHAKTIASGDAPRSFIFPFMDGNTPSRVTVEDHGNGHLVAARQYCQYGVWRSSQFSYPATILGGLARAAGYGDGAPKYVVGFILSCIDAMAATPPAEIVAPKNKPNYCAGAREFVGDYVYPY